MPEEYNGVKQYPLNGVSMRYSFDDPGAPTTRERQYYAMLGTRGIWQDGWKAAALHAPISDKGNFDQDRWALYHVAEDRSESTDVADQYPDKLKELIDVWFEEATNNFVLPLDDRSATEILANRTAPGRAAAGPLHLLPRHRPGARRCRGQRPRPLLQDRRQRRPHARRPRA